jgi:hypothetical protein
MPLMRLLVLDGTWAFIVIFGQLPLPPIICALTIHCPVTFLVSGIMYIVVRGPNASAALTYVCPLHSSYLVLISGLCEVGCTQFPRRRPADLCCTCIQHEERGLRARRGTRKEGRPLSPGLRRSRASCMIPRLAHCALRVRRTQTSTRTCRQSQLQGTGSTLIRVITRRPSQLQLARLSDIRHLVPSPSIPGSRV